MAENTGDPKLAERFLTAYGARDWAAFRELLTDDVAWNMPGTGSISGTARGKDAIVDRIQSIAAHGIKTELLHVLLGQSGVTLSLRNTAEAADGRKLDEHLATVLTVRDGRIAVIDTFLSDVDGMSAFFNRPR